MNKTNDIAILNRSAENTATVHMRDRCGALGKMREIYKLNHQKIFTFV